MKVQYIQNNYPAKYNIYHTTPIFKGVRPVETIKNCNIGMMADGIIGKVEIEGLDGKRILMDVEKIVDKAGLEYYAVLDQYGGILGEIEFKPTITSDTKHVWIEHLVSHYSNFMEAGNYTGIGTRLMQIALKRSKEAGCDGNIELFTTETGEGFYKKLGLETFFPVCNSRQQHRMFLPASAKEALSKRMGGL